MDDRVGDQAVADRLEVVSVAFERGAGHGGAQADLGRHRTAGAAERPVAQRAVDGRAGSFERGCDVLEVEQWRERVLRHPTTVAGRPAASRTPSR